MKKLFYAIAITGIAFCLISKAAYAQNLDPQKEKKAKAEFKNTLAHKQWASIEDGGGKTLKPFAKPKNDPEALGKVKKVAIISFEMILLREEENRAKGLLGVAQAVEELNRVRAELEPFKPHLNEMYEILKQQFEKYGYTVIPVEEVKNNDYYKSLEFKEEEDKAKGAWGGGWKIDTWAYDLKNIRAEKLLKFPISNNKTIIEKVTGRLQQMQELAKSLGVDAVILVESNAVIDFKWGKGKLTFGNTKTPGMEGLQLDLFSATEPRLIWSAALKKAIKWPTNVRSTSALLVGRGFSGVDQFGPDMKKFFETYGELAAINMVLSSRKY